ncbi:DUF5659 domain-containing protein [Fictibacillus phosphorivorans]|uniref:DUF5659 domain-containing protein n=1 Tax=Fictibacillus phosphorivorans TaxID=1221500 RepID=UPI00203AC1D0|nr:DUF5659 domain-containing protein [Fictibacillus phosphorivorans]MCM3719172.1 DUF5659 domain-containing protein [Fictibacillus phosphorivorans]MCM3776794.1 DUF5659 domain-containing protein [Fictibacillus phosphorivorans]
MLKKDFFFVYNKKVSDFLKERGHEVITIAQDLKSKKVFSLFQITPELQQALTEYKALKK